jgi:hypothetical protein
MIFTSFEWSFDPPAATTGSPIVTRRSVPSANRLDFFLETNRTSPSSAQLLTSLGVSLPPARRDGNMVVQPTGDFSTFFFSSGVFASALTSGIVRIFVEEFDGAGNFLRGIDGASQVLAHHDVWWFSGSQSTSPAAVDQLIALPPIDLRIPVRRGNRYRVWVDLHGAVRGAGFGGIGGSGAISQVFLHLDELEILLDSGDW